MLTIITYTNDKEDGDRMAKRRCAWNQEQYHRYLKEGRGQGTKSAYKPWIVIHDFPSNGIVSRAYGNTTGRIHHLLSNMELSYFYLLDWSEKVIATKINVFLCLWRISLRNINYECFV